MWTLFEFQQMLKMSSTSVHKLYHTIIHNLPNGTTFNDLSDLWPPFQDHDIFRHVNLFLKLWTALFCGSVFSNVIFNHKTVFGFKWSFRKASCIALQAWYLQGGFKFGELGEPYGDSSHAGMVERPVLLEQHRMYLAESATPSGSSWLQSSINFGSRSQLSVQFFWSDCLEWYAGSSAQPGLIS